MFMPKISVVIPCYNAQDFIAEAIESVLDQTYKPYEIIVIDDGSTDKSAEIIKKYVPPVKLIQQENRGRVEARKTGFYYATGQWIALLDADDYWAKEKLEKQVEVINSIDKSVVMIHTNDKWIGNIEDHNATYVSNRPKLMDFPYLFQRNIIATSSVLLRKDVLDEVIPFWNLGRLRAQDYGLYLLMLCHGFAYYIDKTLSFYRMYESNVHDTLSFSIGRLHARLNVLSYIRQKGYQHLLSFDWRRIMADNCLQVAWLYYLRHDYKLSRYYIAKAFSYKFIPPKWILLYCLLFFPKNFVIFLRRLLGSESLKETNKNLSQIDLGSYYET